ncbi:MAG: cytochrome C [Gammaproteobacteria bacterium RIFCSPLOWO2_02_FULL_57_10]|nr:MAG: cytochrome C [Gammaproteobacteria bacterium RIFCSPLOWO2_02_FULL_57_10]
MKALATKTVLTLLSTLAFAAFATTGHAQGDATAGQAKAAVCGACHGATGDSAIAANPKLAGQNANYLFKQMQDIKSGARTVALMTGLLNNSSDQDMQDIAAFYASQEGSVEGADPELVELGESIYRSGIASLNVAACTACHSPTGQGNSQAGFPALGGQHAEYTATQLKAFRSGDRTNDGTAAPMRIVSERLTDKEIEALASYISGLN